MTELKTRTAIDGSLLSEMDVQRAAAEEALHAEQASKAARVIAAHSRDIDDCRLLLGMLGLDARTIGSAGRRPAA
jgi:hypothetical protein